MTTSQERKYLYAWGEARRWYRQHGLDPKQADAKRHFLHRKALGYDKSHYDFDNRELTAVLNEFAAISHGGDLNGQMARNERADQQRAIMEEECLDAVFIMFKLGDRRLETKEARIGYLRGTAKNIVGKEPADCTEAELGKVRGSLRRRVAVLKKKNPAAAALVEQPF